MANVVLVDRGMWPSSSERANAERCAFGDGGAAHATTVRLTGLVNAGATASPEPLPANPVAAGRLAVAQLGCLGCHRIGSEGNVGPGPNLSDIGARLSRSQTLRALVDPEAPMPSFRNIPPGALRGLVAYLATLHSSS